MTTEQAEPMTVQEVEDRFLPCWGGEVKRGQPCWLIDGINYRAIPVEAAAVVEVNGEVMLLHENRLKHWTSVAATEERALAELRHAAITHISRCTEIVEKARAFLGTQPGESTDITQ